MTKIYLFLFDTVTWLDLTWPLSGLDLTCLRWATDLTWLDLFVLWLETCLRLDGRDLRIAWDLNMCDLPPPLVMTFCDLRPVHTKDDNYKDNDISVHTSRQYRLFILSARSSAVLNSWACNSRMDSDWLSMFYRSSAGTNRSESDPNDIVYCAFIVIVVVWTLLFFNIENDF